MLILRRFFIWLVVAIIAAIYELEVIYPESFLIFIVGVTILTELILYLSYDSAKISKKDFLFFTVSPLLLVWGTYSFLFFLENLIVIQLIIVLSSFFLGTYLDNFFFFSKIPLLYQPFSLENVSLFVNTYSLFLITSSVISLRVFFNLGLEVVSLLYVIILFLFLAQSFWINKLGLTKHWPYLAIIALVTIETFLALDYLYFDYFVKSILTVSAYFFLINVSLLKIKNSLTSRNFWFNFGLTAGIWFLTIVTARWF